ncbi:unnamed protein product [Chrysoparadoxa australica]
MKDEAAAPELLLHGILQQILPFNPQSGSPLKSPSLAPVPPGQADELLELVRQLADKLDAEKTSNLKKHQWLQRQVGELESQVGERENDIRKLEQEKQDALGEVQAVRDAANKAVGQLIEESLGRERKKMQQERELDRATAAEALQALEKEKTQVQARLEAAQQLVKTKEADGSASVSQLSAEINVLQERAASLEKENAFLADQKKLAEEYASQLHTQIGQEKVTAVRLEDKMKQAADTEAERAAQRDEENKEAIAKLEEAHRSQMATMEKEHQSELETVLEGEKQLMKQRKEAAAVAFKQLEAEKSELAKVVKRAEGQAKTAQRELEALQTQLGTPSEQQLQDTSFLQIFNQRTKVELAVDFYAATKDLSTITEKLVQLKKKSEERKAQISSLEEELSLAGTEKGRLRDLLSSANKENEQLQGKLTSDEDRQMHSLRESLADAQRRLSQKEGEVKALASQGAQSARLMAEVQELEREREELRGQCVELQAQCVGSTAQHGDEVAQLKAEVMLQREKAAELERGLQVQVQETQLQTRAKEEALAQLDALAGEVSEMRSQVYEAESREQAALDCSAAAEEDSGAYFGGEESNVQDGDGYVGNELSVSEVKEDQDEDGDASVESVVRLEEEENVLDEEEMKRVEAVRGGRGRRISHYRAPSNIADIAEILHRDKTQQQQLATIAGEAAAGEKEYIIVMETGESRVRCAMLDTDDLSKIFPIDFPCQVASPKKKGADLMSLVNSASGLSSSMYEEFRNNGGFFIGSDAWTCCMDHPDAGFRSKLQMQCPYERGQLNLDRSEDLQRLWKFAYDAHHQDASCCPTVLICKSTATLKEVAALAAMMFGQIGVPSLRLVNEASLVARAAGMETCIVVDIGEGSTRVCPVYCSSALSESARSDNVGASDIIAYLDYMLLSRTQQDYNQMTDRRRLAYARIIMHEHAYVSMNFESEARQKGHFVRKSMRMFSGAQKAQALQGYEEVSSESYHDDEELDEPEEVMFTQKNGNEIIMLVGREKFHAPEILFKPELWPESAHASNVPELVVESVLACDPEIREEMVRNVLLTGSLATMKNLSRRLENELFLMFPEHLSHEVRVSMVDDPVQCSPVSTTSTGSTSAALRGAELMCMEKNDGAAWITAEEYQEDSKIVRRAYT